jgi:lipoyl(octanoyl) transferase
MSPVNNNINQHTLFVHDAQRMAYAACLDLQRAYFDKATNAKQQGVPVDEVLILVEHPPVYTLGKSGKMENLLLDEQAIQKMGASFYRSDRGGDITFHGPGQLVGYPIIDLSVHEMGVKRYVELLEESVIMTLASYGIIGARHSKAPGVWLDPDGDKARKICALGVRVSRGITMHGFALNVSTDLDYFTKINPCGFTDKSVTSMEKELGMQIDFEEVKLRYEKCFISCFLHNNSRVKHINK